MKVYLIIGALVALLAMGFTAGWRAQALRSGVAIAKLQATAAEQAAEIERLRSNAMGCEATLAEVRGAVDSMMTVTAQLEESLADVRERNAEQRRQYETRIAELLARPLPADCEAAVREAARRAAEVLR